MAATTTDPQNRDQPRLRWIDRWHAVKAAFGLRGSGFKGTSRPQSVGRVSRGRRMAAGRFLLDGFLVEAPDTAIWDLPMPNPSFEAELHGFSWLDDLAATGDARMEVLARDWTRAWPERFGRGRGPGWNAALTGRRLMRWVDHADLLMDGADARQTRRLSRSLAQQAVYLSRRWRQAAPGLPRFEALAGLLHAALAQSGTEVLIDPAAQALAHECAERIGADGGLPGRNPEELLAIFALLASSISELDLAGFEVPAPLREAVAAMAPTLRTLRHADGGLARFHGGGRGVSGRLDLALSLSGVKPGPPSDQAMGFARLSRGRTTVIVDAAPPPEAPAADEAHASTLAFELTSGRRPLIVSCGSGRPFGGTWRRAGRATPSHSTLAIDGYSSARLGDPVRRGDTVTEPLIDAPRDVRLQWLRTDRFTGLAAGHDGYLATHGLTHVRQIHLGHDGRSVHGEDMLVTVERSDRPIFDRARAALEPSGLPFRVRFHLHPDVVARLDSSGRAVSLRLKSGELWVFRHDGAAELGIEPSVYLDGGALEPRPTTQIVLAATASDYATRVTWILAKDRQTPQAVRDCVHDDLPVLV